MAKTRYVGDFISGKAMDNKKVPLGTVVNYEPHPGFPGAPSMLTRKGWVRQDNTIVKRGYRTSAKHWRILHVGNGNDHI